MLNREKTFTCRGHSAKPNRVMNLYRPSSSKSKTQYSSIKINTSVSSALPPPIFTMPNNRKLTSGMGNSIEREELYENNIQLRESLNKLEMQLKKSKYLNVKNELELRKKEKLIQNFVDENSKEIKDENKIISLKESALITKFKNKYNKLQLDYEKLKANTQILEANKKLTNIKEYQIENGILNEELKKIKILYQNSKKYHENYMMRRIEYLKEKKFEKSLLKSIKEGIEKEKMDAIEKKKKENDALVKAVKENDIKMKLKKEKEKREKEEDVKMGKERMIMQMKEDNKRQKYYDMIRSYGNKLSDKSNELLAKMKKEQEDEDKRIHHYYVEQNKLAMEKEKKEELKKSQQKFELKKYLDMQVEEKKKEEEFLKSLDYEQARIWAIDCKKYNEDEKAIQDKLRSMNKRNMNILMEQINKKKSKKKNQMNDNEYAMNKKLLEKVRSTLSE